MEDPHGTDRVPVISSDNEFLSYTHSAKARKLLRDGRAEVFQKSPFIIKLKGQDRREQMIQRPTVSSFTEFFKGEERDIYVRNNSAYQISMQVETAPGRTESITIGKSIYPVNLTQRVPFSALKNSTDFRKMVNRQPPVLEILTEEQYLKVFEDIAKQNKTAVEDEIAKAERHHTGVMEKTLKTEPETFVPETIEEKLKKAEESPTPEDRIIPRVMGLCANVGDDVDKDHRMSAQDFMNELKLVESTLKPIDLEYVMSHGYYKSVKNWARGKLDEVVGSSEE